MNKVDQTSQGVWVGLGEYAMAQVKDVAGPPGVVIEHSLGFGFDDRPVGEDYGRVEVALHSGVGTKAVACGAELCPKVDADDIGAGITHKGEKFTCSDAEMQAGYSEVGDSG